MEKFLKAIHLKGEVGVFVFYTEKNDIPIISLYECCTSDLNLQIYNSFENIQINKLSFNIYFMLNDLVKLNENQICFVSTSSDKLYL